MMNTSELVSASAEALIPYMRDQLGRGSEVAQCFLETVVLEDGEVFSTMPRDFPAEAVNDPVGGCVKGPRHLSRNEQWDRLGRVIHSDISQGVERLYVAEAALYGPTHNLHEDPPLHFHDDRNVYFFAGGDASLELVRRLLDSADSPWTSLGFLTSSSGQELPPIGTRWDDALLRSLGAAADACVIGAYDQEAHLIWRKRAKD